MLIVSALGVVIGGLAGCVGRIVLGAVAGAVLSVAVYLGTAPAVIFLQLLGAVTKPPLYVVLVIGALSGVVGGVVERLIDGREPSRAP